MATSLVPLDTWPIP